MDDLDKALEGREVIIPPNSPGEGVTVAFILVDGAPVELLKFDVVDIVRAKDVMTKVTVSDEMRR